MELEAENGTRIPIQKDSETEVGRGLGLGLGLGSGPAATTADRTVSRRHLSLRLIDPAGDEADGGGSSEESRVSFEVIGKNPILVYSSCGGDRRVYRNSERGELRAGDRFSLSLKNSSFFIVGRKGGGGKAAGVEKRVLDAVERRERRTLERRKEKEKERRARAEAPGDEGDEEDTNGGLELELGSMDVSHIDPVREFGFLVRGHEFDHYPKQKIRPIEDWNWFLEDPRGVSDDEEATSPKGKVRRRKKKRGGDSEDEDWSGESEEEKVMVAKVGSAKRAKYSTRFKGVRKQHNDASSSRHSALTKDVKTHKDKVMEEDEEDETLGGFIVDDEEEEEEEEVQEEDWEEEEGKEEEYDND